jgi:hypothetical protein
MSISSLLVGDPSGEAKWKALDVYSIDCVNLTVSGEAIIPGFTGPTGSTGSTGATGATGSTGASASLPSLNDGQLIIGRTSQPTNPVAANLTVGRNVSITNSAGDIKIAVVDNPNFDSLSIGDGQQISDLFYVLYTPVLRIGGSSTGITYSSQIGRIIRMGKLIFVQAELGVTGTNSLTGTIQISVPFAADGTRPDVIPVAWSSFTFDTLAGPGLVAISNAASIYFDLIQLNSDGTTTACTEACFSGGTSVIKFSGCYFANS